MQIDEAPKTQNVLNSNRATLRHIIIKLSKGKGKEGILKRSKRKERSYIKGNTHKIIGRFLIRSFSRQERMGSHIQNIERK